MRAVTVLLRMKRTVQHAKLELMGEGRLWRRVTCGPTCVKCVTRLPPSSAHELRSAPKKLPQRYSPARG